MKKVALVLSGHIENLQDNVIEFIKEYSCDVYIHTWDTPENNRWLKKLRRIEYTLDMQPLSILEKKFSILHSTFKAVDLIKDLFSYDLIILCVGNNSKLYNKIAQGRSIEKNYKEFQHTS